MLEIIKQRLGTGSIRNFSIRSRLLLLCGALIADISIVSIVCLSGMSNANRQISNLYDHQITAVVNLIGAFDNLHRVRIRTYDAAFSQNKERAQQLSAEFDIQANSLLNYWSGYKKLPLDKEEMRIVPRIEAQLPIMLNYYRAMLAKLSEGQGAIGGALLAQGSTAEFRNVAGLFRELFEHERAEIDDQNKIGTHDSQLYTIICYALVIGGLAFGALISWIIVASITKPVDRLVENMECIAACDVTGNKFRDYGDTYFNDELGKLGRILGIFRQHAIELLRLRESQVFTVERQRDSLDELVNERTKELTSARDDALAAVRAKTDFLSHMTHELRTPMNVINGFNELLLTTSLDEKQRKYANNVRDASNSLLSVIGDILDFASLESGKAICANEPFDVSGIIDDVMAFMVPAAEQNGLSLFSEVGASIQEPLIGDAARIRQIVINLVGNALKFTKRGSIKIAASYELVDKADARCGNLMFRVSDTGIGIPDDLQGVIFEEFQQGSTGFTKRFSGTGLGLAICKRLCAALGGKIGVESKLGIGSTFWFSVPCPILNCNTQNGKLDAVLPITNQL